MHPRLFMKLLLVCFFCLVLAGVSWWLTPGYSGGDFFGQPLIPGMLEKINDVSAISIEHEGETETFVKDTGGNWTLLEAEHYPADKERIRNTLIGIANLQKIEAKTALPEFYKDIGVEDISAPGAKSYLVTLLDNDGKEMSSLLVGKSVYGIRWDGNGYFVRFPREAQSWLARGYLDVTGDVRSWLYTRILPVRAWNISSIALLNGLKKREIIFERPSPQTPFQVAFQSDPYFLTDQNYLKGLEENLASIDFTDVAQRPEDIGKYDPFLFIFLKTFTDIDVEMKFYSVKDGVFVTVDFSASKEASDVMKKEAERLQGQYSKWFYLIPNSKVSALLPFLNIPEKLKENIKQKSVVSVPAEKEVKQTLPKANSQKKTKKQPEIKEKESAEAKQKAEIGVNESKKTDENTTEAKKSSNKEADEKESVKLPETQNEPVEKKGKAKEETIEEKPAESLRKITDEEKTDTGKAETNAEKNPQKDKTV